MMTQPTDFELPGDDPHWYRDAIIYEVHVRAYQDSNGDGVGDFRGLTQRLDYLQALGITVIWLLPFYPSPLKDDGYDIADYRRIHPSYGTMRDFRAFLRAAAARGIRVVTELIINHTSDQHPWFQRARRAPAGSRYRDFYVWSDTADRYPDTRIIFQDYESSNWTWDGTAGAYFWHRFYSHQPDLNFDNPRVRDAVFDVMDSWLSMGVSGLRLDAVPYLYERDGTDNENLPETHAFLKELRKRLDERYPDRFLLAEANQWPEDAAAYFGDGDECHMNFYFPLMPRLFMGLRSEDASPIVDILEHTPRIPDGCQWAIFLRNHDELTLEMVTDEERDYMYRMYAHDREMRVNLGIRRRLAPLLNNDRRKMELMNGLLLSLPGTPVIYYGDEIGMGDNFYLGDRNGVRTPMQWNADRNAGFSRANPQRLYMPVVIDPEYHYEAVNVEVQESNPDSLLWWMRRSISLRKRHPAFGRGDIRVLRSDNNSVLAFLRSHGDDTVLVVANLSRHFQCAEVDLAEYGGARPVELSSGNRLPEVGEVPYQLVIGPYDFMWLELKRPERDEVPAGSRRATPVDLTRRSWNNLLRRDAPAQLAESVFDYVRDQRWYGGKARNVRAVSLLGAIAVSTTRGVVHVAQLRVVYTEGEPDVYQVPLALATPGADMEQARSWICPVRLSPADGGGTGAIVDAMEDPVYAETMVDAMTRRRRFGRPGSAQIVTWRTPLLRRLTSEMEPGTSPRLLGAEQSNTSVVFGDRLILKFYRRVHEGTNPDVEIGRKLSAVRGFNGVSRVAGAFEVSAGGELVSGTLGVVNEYVAAASDAREYTLGVLRRFYEYAVALGDGAFDDTPPGAPSPAALIEAPDRVIEAIGPYLLTAELLGRRTAELHAALSLTTADPDFAPVEFTRLYQRSLAHRINSSVRSGLRTLRARRSQLEVERVRGLANEVLDRAPAFDTLASALTERRLDARAIRIHGDYHLGQVLYTGQDLVIIDFEGEPARPLSERRIKSSPLRDVAGMLRSFHYAARTELHAVSDALGATPGTLDRLELAGRFWYAWAGTRYLAGYMSVPEVASLIPRDPDDVADMLHAFMLEKAVYELLYELNNRPDWIEAPLRGLLDLAERAE